MANTTSRFYRIKTAASGNREKSGFEYTFGMTVEEQMKITGLNKWTTRILSEIEFLLRLSKEQNNLFDKELNAALDVLEASQKQEGSITNTAAKKAEECLLPAKAAAKEYEVILAAHAHIDMNWMWGWQETVAATLATFRTMLDLMDEYRDFCFSQSQASVYKIVEDFDPELMPRIKQRIDEGRWEITASAWVEPDKNMPDTESMLRHIKYTKDYLKEHWEIDPSTLNIDFVPDTFGHNINVPEIDSFGDVKYMYHCRGLEGDYALYRYKAPSGKEVLCYREQYWYNSAITPHIGIGLVDIAKRQAGLKTGLIVYGVGDHGGGPSRRDIERAIEMQSWPVFPKIKFGTFKEFFSKAEAVRESLPVVDKELNYYAPGCYTSQSRIKMANRKTELALEEAEKMSAFAAVNVNKPFMSKQFEKAWQNVLFTHFHDIITGSCVLDSKEHAMGLLSEAMAVANTQHNNALRNIAENIDTGDMINESDIEGYKNSQAFGAGVGYGLKSYCGVPSPELASGKRRVIHIFNSTCCDINGLCEVTLWYWSGNLKMLSVTDVKGSAIPFAVMDTELQTFWDHKYIRLILKVNVSQMGYTTAVIDEKEPEEYPFYYLDKKRVFVWDENIQLENEYVKAIFDKHTGGLISFVDKATGQELVKQNEQAGLCIVKTESSSSNAWQIGKHFSCEPLYNVTKLTPFSYSDLQQGFTMELAFLNSKAELTVSLSSGSKALCCDMKIDWNEVGGETVPLLIYNIPLSYKPEGYMCDVPGGAVMRKSANTDIPALKYTMAVGKKSSFSVITDGKYGYRGTDERLIATLINPTTYPDPYPERYIHTIKLWVSVGEKSSAKMEKAALALLTPLTYISMNPHKGILPAEGCLCKAESDSVILSGIYEKNGYLFVRMYEACGKNDTIKLSFTKNIQKAFYVNLAEEELSEISAHENCISADMKHNSIVMLKIKFETE